MKPVILEELYAFFLLFVSGIAIGIFFDILRSVRKVFIKNNIAVQISDLLFLTVSFLITLKMLSVSTDGAPRLFALLAAVLGMLLYFLTISRFIICLFSKILEEILKFFRFIFKILLTPARFLYKILLLAFNFMRRKIISFITKIKIKNKKRGYGNDNKEKKTSLFNRFGSRCIFSHKGNCAAAKNNTEQRRNRKLKRTNRKARAENQ